MGSLRTTIACPWSRTVAWSVIWSKLWKQGRRHHYHDYCCRSSCCCFGRRWGCCSNGREAEATCRQQGLGDQYSSVELKLKVDKTVCRFHDLLRFRLCVE